MANRTFVIARSEARQTVGAVLRAHLAVSWPEVRRLIREQRVRLNGTPCTEPNQRVLAGQRLEVAEPRQPSNRPAGTAPPILRFADAHVVVVDKPAGLTTSRHPDEAAAFGVRARRFLPPTLADLLPALLAKSGRSPPVIPVHRLDKETSGLVVFARTPAAARHLGRQFREHTSDRTYKALVRGRAVAATLESYLVPDRGDGRRGSSTAPGVGQRAVTHVRVVEELGDWTLIECRLETGRTHQIRIHLGEAGTPLCGERIYDRPLHGQPLPDGSGAKRMMLHAATLGFEHPATGRRMKWSSAAPRDMAELLGQLRRRTQE